MSIGGAPSLLAPHTQTSSLVGVDGGEEGDKLVDLSVEYGGHFGADRVRGDGAHGACAKQQQQSLEGLGVGAYSRMGGWWMHAQTDRQGSPQCRICSCCI